MKSSVEEGDEESLKAVMLPVWRSRWDIMRPELRQRWRTVDAARR